jgi:hypothetical protein
VLALAVSALAWQPVVVALYLTAAALKAANVYLHKNRFSA